MRLVPFALSALILGAASTAEANPKKLPFSYGTHLMPPGGFELEQYVDIVPHEVAREKLDGTLEGVYSTRYVLQTEMEYGLSERVELGFYLSWRQSASATTPVLRFQGVKQRVRIKILDGLAGYLEIAEFHDEIELEQKLLLSHAFGPLELVANLWVEQEYYFADDLWKFIYNPTAGVTYQLNANATIGLEYWARGRFDDPAAVETAGDDSDTGTRTRHYVGPTLNLARGEYWTTLGAFVRVDSFDVKVGDPFGQVWVRLIVGLGL
jgi:hypothetical protein